MDKEEFAMWEEFKKFALKGNVMDLAIGVVIGGAFGKIVSSLVNDLIMPVVGMLSGGINFSGLVLRIGDAKIAYGSFIQSVVDFFIVAFSLFIAIRAMNRLKKKEPAKEAAPPAPSKEVELLSEIRDLLKEKPAAEK
jgi:large conductance mechanosensitive channel